MCTCIMFRYVERYTYCNMITAFGFLYNTNVITYATFAISLRSHSIVPFSCYFMFLNYNSAPKLCFV